MKKVLITFGVIVVIVIVIFITFFLLGFNKSEQERQDIRDAAHNLGAIMIKDVIQAQEYSKVLPHVFGLSENEMSVDPGSGFTYVTITKSLSETEKLRIIEQVKVLNDGNPNLNPIKVTFKY